MSDRQLDAAGITDPALRSSYEACRRLNAAHGRTYYLATLLLPAAKRPHVHALYGFARYADEIVDDLASTLTPQQRTDWLLGWEATAREGGDDGEGAASVLPAFRHTVQRHGIPPATVEAFLHSMRMDLTVTSYATWEDLLGYTYGSAAVIGLQMLPVLGHPGVPYEVVAPYAEDLGTAFQLANFIRDVGEDLRRGRVYLPQEDLAAFGVTRDHLARGVVDAPVRRLLAFEIARARELFRSAEPGIRLVAAQSRDCLRTAYLLYGGILDAVERADYRVLGDRVAVGPWRRAAVAGPGLLRAWRARSARTPGEPAPTPGEPVRPGPWR